MPLPSGFKIDSQEHKTSVPAGFVLDEPDGTEQSSYAAPKGFILDEITESSPSLKQGQPPTMFERGKEAISDIFRKDPGLGPLSEEDYAAFKPTNISIAKKEENDQQSAIVPEGMEGMPESAIPTGMSMDIPARRAEVNKRLEQLDERDVAEARELRDELQDLKQQEYGTAMTRPISTITGKPVPTPEEKAAGGKAAMALAPYGFASAVRGMIPEALEKAIMQPITKATIGREYVSPIDEALKASGKYLPEGAQKVVGAPARMAGTVVPLSRSFKVANAIMKAAGLPADLVLSTGPVVDQIAGHIARGGLAGAIYGALEEGTPEGMAEDAAFFGVLEGGLGAAGKIFEKIFSSNWYRNLEVPERGLVVQTADDLRRAGHSEGTILRTLSDPVERKRLLEEAAKKRMAPERPSVDLTVNKKRFEENPLDAENNAEYLNKYIEKAKQPKPPAISPPEEILPIESKLTHRALPLKPEEEPSKEIKMKKVSEKIKAETPTMLKESDKVNDVTLEVLVDMAAKDPAKALEHAEEATVSKAKLIEGLKNKGLKAMGEAKSKEERAEIAKNLEETLKGIEGEIKPKIELEAPKEPKSGQKATPMASKIESKAKEPWEMTKEEWERTGEKIKQSVIIADGKIFKAPTHAEAINKAIEQGFVRETSDGLRTKKGDYPEIDLFETDRGRIVNRFIADEIAAVTAGENIGKGGNHKKLVQYAINQNKPVPEKVLAEYPELKPEPKITTKAPKEIIARDTVNGKQYEYRVAKIKVPEAPQLTHQVEMRSVGSKDWESALVGKATSRRDAIRFLAERYPSIGKDITDLEVLDPTLKKFVDKEIKIKKERALEAKKTEKARKEKEEIARAEYQERQRFIDEVNKKKIAGKKTKIPIKLTTGETQNTDAVVFGDYAVHKNLEPYKKGYTVTHTPSSLRILNTDTLKEARTAAKTFFLYADKLSAEKKLMPKESVSKLKRLAEIFTKEKAAPDFVKKAGPKKEPTLKEPESKYLTAEQAKPPGKPKEPIATFLSSKKKAGVNYEMKVKIAETGEVITITKDAAEALRETKKELSRYEKLLACLSS
ncbi:MAG: hypothetical protein B5M48_03810 [Candidatus Omnitrophica bacterium 4484_213]|nr:MAG: hypothetical protein B5M48_03810 [Candidatus Omnitrophica bacterium 4484_213]